MKLHNEILQEFIWSTECEGFTKVAETEGKLRRWSRTNTIVITDGTKFYAFDYEQAATEIQEVDRFNPDSDGMVELREVQPVEKTVTVYEPIATV